MDSVILWLFVAVVAVVLLGRHLQKKGAEEALREELSRRPPQRVITAREAAAREADRRRRLRQEFMDIDRFFDDTTNVLVFDPREFLKKQPSRELDREIADTVRRTFSGSGFKSTGLGSAADQGLEAVNTVFLAGVKGHMQGSLLASVREVFFFQRPLTDMSDRERAVLRLMNKLAKLGSVGEDALGDLHNALVFNGGQNTLAIRQGISTNDKYLGVAAELIKNYLNQKLMPPQMAVNKVVMTINNLLNQPGSDATKQMLRDAIYSGQHWLTPEDTPGSIYEAKTEASLLLGPLADHPGTELQYSGEGSLITIARPGAGKTQCHVFPNLLRYPGPTFVLDVKGECWDQTHAWRQANVGPVYRFDPLNPERSACYNPLWLLPDDPDLLWEDAKMLADLMITSTNLVESTWETEGQTLLATILTWLSYFLPGREERQLGRVLDILSDTEEWRHFIQDATEQDDIPQLRRNAMHFRSMRDDSPRQFQGVLLGARNQLSIWQGKRIETVTRKLDWHPADLRGTPAPTVYLCVQAGDIATYKPVLRVLIGQHLRILTQTMPAAESVPILFMLDELPRLGAMEPVLYALETGRAAGIRLWMFAQHESQLAEAYGDKRAQGIIDNCAVELYMNPSQRDGTALRLARRLGEREGVLDGRRYSLASEHDLAGAAFAQLQIVFGAGAPPAKLDKRFAVNDPVARERMGASSGATAEPPPSPAPSPDKNKPTDRSDGPDISSGHSELGSNQEQ